MDLLINEFHLIYNLINSPYNNKERIIGKVTNLIEKFYFIEILQGNETVIGFYDDFINKRTIMVNTYLSIDKIINTDKKYKIAKNINIIDKICNINLNIEDKLKLDNFNELNNIINNIIQKNKKLNNKNNDIIKKIDDLKKEYPKENHRKKKINADIIILKKKLGLRNYDTDLENAANTIIKYYKANIKKLSLRNYDTDLENAANTIIKYYKTNKTNKLKTTRITKYNDNSNEKKNKDNINELNKVNYDNLGEDNTNEINKVNYDNSNKSSRYYYDIYKNKVNLLIKNNIIPKNIYNILDKKLNELQKKESEISNSSNILDQILNEFDKKESEILNIISKLNNEIEIESLFLSNDINYHVKYSLRLFKKNIISKKTILDLINTKNIKTEYNIDMMLDFYKNETINEYYFLNKLFKI